MSWRASAAGGRHQSRVARLSLLILALLPLAAIAADRKLFIYNWADFIGNTTLSDFQKATGIKVVYDTFDAEETKETKLMAGGSDYDVVVSANEYYSREIKAGVYLPLDKTRLPHWENLDPQGLADQAASDPGNRYALPYLHAINGFAYNVAMIRARMPAAPVDSLDMLFKPEVVRRFADCGVSFLDSPEDILQLALKYLGRNPNTTDAADYKAAEDLVVAVRPYVRIFDSSEYLNALANGELCIAVSWSSDYAVSMARARAAGLKLNLAFTVPKEGANLTYSSLMIPVGAPHLDAAYEFLNFMLRPEVIAKVTNDIYYGNDNRAANPYVNPRILADPTLYPTPEIRHRLYAADEAGIAVERLRSRTWTRIKTGH
ncbi:MAG TPA: extracellular solute-binding protein [Steroidobacteraceae bacterium]